MITNFSYPEDLHERAAMAAERYASNIGGSKEMQELIASVYHSGILRGASMLLEYLHATPHGAPRHKTQEDFSDV